jgi:hypothetical protein
MLAEARHAALHCFNASLSRAPCAYACELKINSRTAAVNGHNRAWIFLTIALLLGYIGVARHPNSIAPFFTVNLSCTLQRKFKFHPALVTFDYGAQEHQRKRVNAAANIRLPPGCGGQTHRHSGYHIRLGQAFLRLLSR